MAKYLVTTFPVSGVQPGDTIDGKDVLDVDLLLSAGLIAPIQEPKSSKSTDKEKEIN
jgi:hypothetical protein